MASVASPSLAVLESFASGRELHDRLVAPVVISFPVPEKFDVCDAFLRLRRLEKSFCFDHDGVVIIGTEPLKVTRTRGVDQPESESVFLRGAVQTSDPLSEMASLFEVPEALRHVHDELNGWVS